jgi:hypothetical protein
VQRRLDRMQIRPAEVDGKPHTTVAADGIAEILFVL